MRIPLMFLAAAVLLRHTPNWCLGNDNPNSIIAHNAKVELLHDDFAFTEGPTADAFGNVYFTDQPNNRILTWTIDGNLKTFLQPCGRANGLFFDHDGSLIACADERNELWEITPDGKHTKIIGEDGFQGMRLNGPNDLWIHPNGSIYFTDPFYKRPYWSHSSREQDVQAVYYLPPNRDAKELRRVDGNLVKPNGIVGTPDGHRLFVADLGAKKTYRYRISLDGELEDRKLFCRMGSDGMTIDSAGNVYLTGQGVTVFNAEGEQIEHIDIDQGWTANVCFGGPDRKTLFITAKSAFYSLKMNVSGAVEPVMTEE